MIRGLVVIKGVVVRGQNVAGQFMAQDWVNKQIQEHAGFIPYHGTLNLELASDCGSRLHCLLREFAADYIEPPMGSGFCRAISYPVRILRKYPGVIILPLVEDYPANKLEVAAPFLDKNCLGLNERPELSLSLRFSC